MLAAHSSVDFFHQPIKTDPQVIAIVQFDFHVIHDPASVAHQYKPLNHIVRGKLMHTKLIFELPLSENKTKLFPIRNGCE